MTLLELPSGGFINADQISDVEKTSGGGLYVIFVPATKADLRNRVGGGFARRLKLDATDTRLTKIRNSL